MFLHRITLNNFKNFKGNNVFVLDNYNLISGENGAGKSTLGLDSILFCLYGHSRQKLEKLLTRDCEGKLSVTLEVDNYKITRKLPVDITIEENGSKLEFPTNREAQKFINDKYQPVETFRKFRMLDITKGINILEQGSTPLLKTLFQFHQDCLNSIRQNLLTKKNHREKFNKESSVLYTIYPSEKRYKFLNEKYEEIKSLVKHITDEHNSLISQYYSSVNKKNSLNNERENLSHQKKSIQEKSVCPLCRNGLSVNEKLSICESLDKKIIELHTTATGLIDEINNQMSIVKKSESSKKEYDKELLKLSNLKFKLETRLKQRDYIYTSKDIEILKKAIDALDRFSIEYVVKWIRGLEPIINDIIKIIDFKVEFKVDKKGNIDIRLLHENQIFDYEDLSSGQKLLLTVGFQLAILLEKGEEGLIIADEGFSSLSEVNLDKLIAMLKQYPLQLIYIIHRVNSIPEGVSEIKL